MKEKYEQRRGDKDADITKAPTRSVQVMARMRFAAFAARGCKTMAPLGAFVNRGNVAGAEGRRDYVMTTRTTKSIACGGIPAIPTIFRFCGKRAPATFAGRQ